MGLISRSAFATATAAILIVGCGGSDDESGTPVIRSGVAGDKQLNQLSAEEAERVCNAFGATAERWISENLDDQVRVICVTFAFVGAMDVAECNQKAAECLETFKEGALGPTTRDGCEPRSAPLTDCTATVAELESCIEGSLDQASSLVRSLTCEALFSEASNPREPATPPTPASCEPLREKCPDLFLEVSEASSSPSDF